MNGPLGELLGLVFVRLILMGTTLTAIAAAWHGNYLPALGIVAALAYFFYLYWRPIEVKETEKVWFDDGDGGGGQT